MKTYFTDADPDLRATQDGAICDRLQKRILAAQGNPELLAQLRKEAKAVRCEILDPAMTHSSLQVAPSESTVH
ncbi:MAG: hypothetical protein AAFY15_00405 [Cyanobacteria bacterium J06648_11]